MDSYVSLPAKRLAHLVHKYVHHCQMKKIEGKSKYFNIAIMAVKVIMLEAFVLWSNFTKKL